MPDVGMTPILVSSTSVEYKGGAVKTDDARNRFYVTSAFNKTDNNQTWLELTKVSAGGAVLGAWRLILPGYKTAGNPSIDHDGTTLIVTNAVYQVGVAYEARTSALALWQIPSVYEVSTAPPPPPPPTGTDLVITAPATVAGTWRRIG